MNIKVKANTNEEFYKGDDRGFLVLVQRMIEDSWYPKVRKAVKNATFDCYEMDGDDFVICFEADGDGVDESTADILQDLADNAVKVGCDKANRSTDPTIADYGLDADYVAWDEPELFHNQWSYAVNLSSKPKNAKSESADESAPKEVDTVLKKNAQGLIDILNDEFKKAGSDAYLTLPYPDQPRFSDGWYLKVKSAGKWDDRSRMLNLKLMGKEYNGVIYKDGEIYLKAGSRPMSHRGTVVNLFTESADEKLSYEKGHKNSKGEDAPWVIRSHEDNRILASFADKSDAKRHLGRMKQYSEQESMQKETKKSEAFQCAYAQIGHDIPDKVIDSIMGELQDLLETYEKDSGGEALDVSCYGDGMDWELYVVAPVGKEKWILNFLDGLGYAKLQDKWHTRLREHDVPVQHGGVFELTGNGLYKNPYPGTRFDDVKEALFVTKTIKNSKQSERLFNKQELERIAFGDKDYDKCVKDVKALLKSKYGMDVDNKDTSHLCRDWMNKLDGMLYQGKSVEDCAKAVAKFCGFAKDNESKKTEGVKLEFQDTLRVPLWLWHAYNFNDTADLTDEEIEKFNQFKEEYKDCHLDDKGAESYFSSRNDFDDLGGPVYDVDVYKMSYKDEKKSDRNGYAPYYFCKSKHDGDEYAVLADADSIHYLPYYDDTGNRYTVAYSTIATSFEPMDNPESSKLYDIVQSKDGRNIVTLTMAEFDDFADVDSHARGDWFKVLLRKRNIIEKKSEALSSKTTYPFSFKFKFESPRVTYAVRDEIDNGDYKDSKLNCVDDDATECEVFTDNPKVIYGLLDNVCKRYNDTYDGELIPDDLKNRFKIGFGLVKTDDPNLDDTALRFGVAINTRQPDGVMVSGELDNVVDFLDEMK